MTDKDLEYLDEKFPKGKTKFRGEAMVLLALARKEGRAEGKKELQEYREGLSSSEKQVSLHINRGNEFQEKYNNLLKKVEKIIDKYILTYPNGQKQPQCETLWKIKEQLKSLNSQLSLNCRRREKGDSIPADTNKQKEQGK